MHDDDNLRAASTSTKRGIRIVRAVNAMDELLGTRAQPERWSRSPESTISSATAFTDGRCLPARKTLAPLRAVSYTHLMCIRDSTRTVPMILDPGPIGAEFHSAGLLAAIRGAQADTVRYPEFVKRSTAAGVIGYWAFLTGKRVIYWGRKGEQHIEEFPKPQA